MTIFPTSDERLKSLSERLKVLARNTDAYSNHVDHDIKAKNLLYNLSLLIAKIIINLEIKDISKKAFLSALNAFNVKNNSKLSFEDFIAIGWIRLVNEEAVMPELVRHFVWKIGHYENEGKPISIPEGKEQMLRCLQYYYNNSMIGRGPRIATTDLNKILAEHSVQEINMQFLVDENIISPNNTEKYYYWNGGDYSRHLRNEIGATIWLLLTEVSVADKFKRYFNLIISTDLWIDNISLYLTSTETLKISESAVSYLKYENDLLNSEIELTKIWLDPPSYSHFELGMEVPDIEFRYDSPYDYIESVKKFSWRYRDIFDWQGTRAFLSPLLRLIISHQGFPTPYQAIKLIFNDITRPYVIWYLYTVIPRNFPQIIPYLLNESELIPLAFMQLNSINIDFTQLPDQLTYDEKQKEAESIKSGIWLEFFNYFLDKLAQLHDLPKEAGQALARVLIDVGGRTFRSRTNSSQNAMIHSSLLETYNTAFKRLSTKRVYIGNVYPRPSINSRLIFSILPDVYNYVQTQVTNNILTFAHSLNLGFVDVCIELLRLSNLRQYKNEVPDALQKQIAEVSVGLTSLLYGVLSNFYSLEESNTDKAVGVGAKQVFRGYEFGVEIVDWGYLYLNLYKHNKLEIFIDEFIHTLAFDINSDRYNEANREQYNKIKLFLKTLLLSFISINKEKELYNIEGMPVKETLTRLEYWIKYFSLKYSTDNLVEGKIDAFYDFSGISGYDLYYEPLIKLLYRCVNLFENEAHTFTRDYFADSMAIDRMLIAVNLLDKKDIKDIISERINAVEMSKFINTSFDFTKLQSALVEAVNSDEHWELAKPLIERVKEHLERINKDDINSQNFLFEINLLLAFKANDKNILASLVVPESAPYRSDNKKGQDLKRYYSALFAIYNEKEYDVAIDILNGLHSSDSKNVKYAFHLFRAKTQKAITQA